MQQFENNTKKLCSYSPITSFKITIKSFEFQVFHRIKSTKIITEKIAKLASEQEHTVFAAGKNHSLQKEKNSELFFFSLSSNEKKLLYHLYDYQKDGKVLSREKMCSLIWETEATRSNLCQLSNLANRIKKKLAIYQFPDGELTTSWNKGYFLGDLLFSEIEKNMS